MAINNKLVVIVGPTASGKSEMALKIARKYNGEIICADSRTIYRCMDIGTAKPSPAEQKSIRHHLIDIKDPNQTFSVVEFKTLCTKIIAKVQARGKLPILVGGSGLYIDSVLFDYQFRRLKRIIDTTTMSNEQKLSYAQELYPQELAKIDGSNHRRVEQLLRFGPASDNDRALIKIPSMIVGIKPLTPTLKYNIEQRTKRLLNNGFVQEVVNIRMQHGSDCAGLESTGYKQVGEYLDGTITSDELERAINSATINLAKKQITWFKRNNAIHWATNPSKAEEITAKYLIAGLIQ